MDESTEDIIISYSFVFFFLCNAKLNTLYSGLYVEIVKNLRSLLSKFDCIHSPIPIQTMKTRRKVQYLAVVALLSSNFATMQRLLLHYPLRRITNQVN